ncbi:3-isopropylmalate dehydratase small subunit [Novosphingobium resinovorum]|uniref:3-isopropylmalate dehydratase small subunit n=1 Tax=Novosphingobium resinovorum TaxID=158500 RepID=UPI002ED4CD68|nr:3-isopropylmalate dehydratase small subunit [Novosphingobium resinovorum]
MTPFTRFSGIAAPFNEDSVDTDVIFPARYLLLLDLAGLGARAFHDRRYTPEGDERGDFVLNRDPWRTATILVAGANFGCGSSREQAVWCLADFGIRCVIAGSFGDIFAANCINNGVLPVALAPEPLARVSAAAAAGEALTIDLEARTIEGPGFATLTLPIADKAREALLAGRDTLGMILETHGEAFARFEAGHRAARPWLTRTTGD